MSGGGGSTSAQSTDKSDKSSDALSSEQMQAIANQKLADAQRAQYLLSSTPVQQYYTPQAQQPAFMQSPTLRIPGFQGVRNPFVQAQAPMQAGVAPQDRAAQVSNLLNQTNQYRQNYASQLYQAQQANNAQLAAMQKAYQDKMAADKAKAEAEAARARAEIPSWGTMVSDIGSGGGAANGGIADLYQGFK